MSYKENKKLYQNTVENINKIGSYGGVDFLLRDISKPIAKMGYAFIFIILSSDLCIFYSIYNFQNDFESLAFLLTTSGVAFVLNQKMFVMFTMNNYVHRIIQEVNIILERTSKYPNQASMMHKGMIAFELIYKAISLAFSTAGVLMLTISLVISLYESKKYLVLGHIVPYFDHKTSPGYEINYFCHVIQIWLCVVVLVTFDFCFYGHVFIACSHKLSMIHILDEFDRITETTDATPNLEEIERCLKRLIVEHQSHVRLIRNLSDYTGMSNLAVVFASMSSIIFTIFALVEFFWIPGLAFVIVIVSQLLLFGTVGTMYIICVERFETAIYNCKWYLLPLRTQKALSYILMMSQSPIMITIGGYATVDLQAFLKCMKTCYSVTMMLLNRTK
uniref:Odorant receptor n=1 Tax=Lutzomyia longipalpis TaxID=7200 RepID=A0A3F2ZD77_LUTLO